MDAESVANAVGDVGQVLGAGDEVEGIGVQDQDLARGVGAEEVLVCLV